MIDLKTAHLVPSTQRQLDVSLQNPNKHRGWQALSPVATPSLPLNAREPPVNLGICRWLQPNAVERGIAATQRSGLS
ncbi:MAG: hypothetical protein K0B16_17295 [Burkholderiaceae bacterium]|nr:hypothetical protein [Burkholderiaceae bacterium]